MKDSLVVLMGILRGDERLNEEWKEQVEMIKREAIPVVAIRRDPLPAVLLDREKRSEVEVLIQTLKKAGGDAPAYWVVWCSLLTQNLDIAESFLLVNVTHPVPYRFTLRFHLLRHLSVLEAIEQTGRLGIFVDPQTEVIVVDAAAPELESHLAQVRLFQQQQAKKGE